MWALNTGEKSCNIQNQKLLPKITTQVSMLLAAAV
jgi:hypothetical protein